MQDSNTLRSAMTSLMDVYHSEIMENILKDNTVTLRCSKSDRRTFSFLYACCGFPFCFAEKKEFFWESPSSGELQMLCRTQETGDSGSIGIFALLTPLEDLYKSNPDALEYWIATNPSLEKRRNQIEIRVIALPDATPIVENYDLIKSRYDAAFRAISSGAIPSHMLVEMQILGIPVDTFRHFARSSADARLQP
jgi:hypothetical protein